jgi:EmrB/QacA subfamily drug resistance transporter
LAFAAGQPEGVFVDDSAEAMRMTSNRVVVPLIVACPILLQNIDLSAMTVALPSMARSLGVPPLDLSATIASYAISLAAFLPLSAWMADRFGAKRMFIVAIMVFAAASALCGAAGSAATLILFRVIQGFGAAMMIPVGRLILIRTIPPAEFMLAMIWFTIPPAFGRLAGPLVGGLIVTVSSWRWIFFVNIPIGLLAAAAALLLVPKVPAAEDPPRFDLAGFLIMGVGLGALLAGLETFGKRAGLGDHALVLIALGVAALALYALYSFRPEHPVIDLRILRHKSLQANVVGAFPFRVANAAVPFLLPFMLQLCFGFSPLLAGLISAGSAVGSLGARWLMKAAMARFSLRVLLVAGCATSVVSIASFGLFSATWNPLAMFGWVALGGMITSLCFVSLNTVGFAEVGASRSSHATAMVAMAQQVSSALGVVLAASALTLMSALRSGDVTHQVHSDFLFTFVLAAVMASLSILPFAHLGAAYDREAAARA